MKIAFIGQKGIPAKIGGVERYVEAVSQYMVKFGHEAFVYTRPNYTPKILKKYKGVNLISLPSLATKNLEAITHTFLATVHALGQDYDVIHYHGVGPSLLSFIPRLLKPSCQVVVTFQSLDRKHGKWSKLAKLILHFGEWTACHFPHQTISASQSLQQYCLQHYNKPTTYIPNGVYSVKLSNTQIKKVLDKFNLTKQQFFLVPTRFIPHKRIEDVMKAFSKVNSRYVKLVIVGGASYTTEYANYLQQLASENKRVVLLDYIPAEELFPLMATALAVVSASADEGMPMTILEAMSLGAPTVLSNIEGHREIIQSKATLLFPVGNLRSLQNKLQYVLDNKAAIKQMALADQSAILAKYSWEDVSKEMCKIYTNPTVATRSLAQTLF